MSFCVTKNVSILYTGIAALIALWVPRSHATVLEWNSPTDPQIAGYKAYIGQESRRYLKVLDVRQQNWVTLSGLDPGTTYYLSATAYDANGFESDFSEEIPYTPPIDGASSVMIPFAFESGSSGVILRMSGLPGQRCWIVASTDLKTWTQIRSFTFSDNSMVEVTDPNAASFPMRFYRVIASRQ